MQWLMEVPVKLSDSLADGSPNQTFQIYWLMEVPINLAIFLSSSAVHAQHEIAHIPSNQVQ